MPNVHGPITAGKDFNYFQLVTVTDTSFPTNAQCVINVKGIQTFSLLNYGSITVQYSFNGNTVHGDLRASTPSAGIFFDNRRATAIWFKLASGGSSEVRIEAWAAK